MKKFIIVSANIALIIITNGIWLVILIPYVVYKANKRDRRKSTQFKSDIASTLRKLTLSINATMDIGYTNFTDIDASFGRKIWVWKPTLSNTSGIFSLTYLARMRKSDVYIT